MGKGSAKRLALKEGEEALHASAAAADAATEDGDAMENNSSNSLSPPEEKKPDTLSPTTVKSPNKEESVKDTPMDTSPGDASAPINQSVMKDNDPDYQDDPMDIESKSSSEKSGSSEYNDNNSDDDDDDGNNVDEQLQDEDDDDDIPGVNPTDVLFGRFGKFITRNRKGNRLYWNAINQQASLYADVKDDKEAQYDLARKVIHLVEKEHDGRFMEYDSDKDLWEAADAETVLNKVRRSIKEKWERSRGGSKSSKSSSTDSVTGTGHHRKLTVKPSENAEPAKTNTGGIRLMENDVILHFGHSRHNGNMLYWDFALKEAVPKFGDILDDTNAQYELAKKVIHYVEETNGGRFLQPKKVIDYVEETNRGRFLHPNSLNGWEVVPDETVISKVRRAIKERWERSHKGYSSNSSTQAKKLGSSDIDVQPMDAFLGRPDSSLRSHEGNELYWEFLTKQVPQYGKLLGDRKAQFDLAGKVVDYVTKENGGRFLEMDDDGKWGVATESVARDKVRRAIREKWEKSFASGGTRIDTSMAAPKHQEEPDDQPDVKPMDVLIGKANGSREGNKLYWDCVMERVPLYAAVSDDRDAQFKMAQEVIDVVEKKNGGRFLEYNEETGLWVVASDTTVLQKVRRAIKEKWERETKKGRYLPSGSSKKKSRSGSVDSRAKHPSQDGSAKRAKIVPKVAPKLLPKKNSTLTSEQSIQLTHDIVDILKGEKKAIILKHLAKRVEADLVDVDGVIRSVSELGMIHILKEEEIRNLKRVVVTKVVWWEYAGSFLKRKSWEMMPLGEDTEHAMRSEMSLLVREEAKLDVWISRLRNLMSNPSDPEHLYMTATDIQCAVNLDTQAAQPTTLLGRRSKKIKKEPAVAVHAPFGTMLQSSTPISYQREGNTERTRQLVVSCERPSQNDDGVDRKDPLQVFFFPSNQQQRPYVLHQNPVLGWIREPRYTSESNGLRGAGDSLHVSCLKEEEGVSSFF